MLSFISPIRESFPTWGPRNIIMLCHWIKHLKSLQAYCKLKFNFESNYFGHNSHRHLIRILDWAMVFLKKKKKKKKKRLGICFVRYLDWVEGLRIGFEGFYGVGQYFNLDWAKLKKKKKKKKL
jgi:hypothetical protein